MLIMHFSSADEWQTAARDAVAKMQVRDEATICRNLKPDIITDLPEKANATKKKPFESCRGKHKRRRR